MYLEDILKSILIGITGAICFLYAFQTRIPLPLWVLNLFNHPWIIFLVFLFIIFISEWSDKIAAFLLLLIVALIIDHTIFMKKHNKDYELLNSSNNMNTDTNNTINNYNDSLNLQSFNDNYTNHNLTILNVSDDTYPLYYGNKEPEIGPAPF